MRATAFTPPISSHHPTWWARWSTKGGLGRWQGTGCVSPSVCVPFHCLLPVSPSSFAFERTVPVKKAPAHESKCQGQRASLTELHQRQRTMPILRDNTGFFASRRLQVDNLYFIWKIEQENNYQLRSDKICGVSSEQDKKVFLMFAVTLPRRSARCLSWCHEWTITSLADQRNHVIYRQLWNTGEIYYKGVLYKSKGDL